MQWMFETVCFKEIMSTECHSFTEVLPKTFIFECSISIRIYFILFHFCGDMQWMFETVCFKETMSTECHSFTEGHVNSGFERKVCIEHKYKGYKSDIDVKVLN
ncbi:hypothetical protein LOTGIDRAFT_176064 [Lottia gigantea]|uniref:Uncharacterized protein n=1 Tax=Lottia gigantea TaxID=225164 RepID=V3ZLR9_LOTGI|nr:hypothetical protein LOTGIDRAFT_176064 [Lottia gigantea]ESO85257.1 hypothetical protein LOTGIDRAFT_176064 [Lottia gigantea]